MIPLTSTLEKYMVRKVSPKGKCSVRTQLQSTLKIDSQKQNAIQPYEKGSSSISKFMWFQFAVMYNCSHHTESCLYIIDSRVTNGGNQIYSVNTARLWYSTVLHHCKLRPQSYPSDGINPNSLFTCGKAEYLTQLFEWNAIVLCK